jgi:hypothetical protein
MPFAWDRPDGKTLLSVFRLNSDANLWQTTSTDQGRTWVAATETSAWAVFPQLRALPSGALVSGNKNGHVCLRTDASVSNINTRIGHFSLRKVLRIKPIFGGRPCDPIFVHLGRNNFVQDPNTPSSLQTLAILE